MPIFEYRCRTCGHAFEELVARADTKVPCPKCDAATEKLFSSFAASVGSSKSAPVCGGGGCAPGGT
jgi:putative FmdB family regulatory protein